MMVVNAESGPGDLKGSALPDRNVAVETVSLGSNERELYDNLRPRLDLDAVYTLVPGKESPERRRCGFIKGFRLKADGGSLCIEDAKGSRGKLYDFLVSKFSDASKRRDGDKVVFYLAAYWTDKLEQVKPDVFQPKPDAGDAIEAICRIVPNDPNSIDLN